MDNQDNAKLMAELEADFEAFAYSVAHDLHAPIRAILHFSKLLQRSCASKLEPRELDLLARVPDLAEKTQGMLDALLLYSRLGRERWEPATLDLEKLLQTVVTSCQQKLPEQSAEISIQTQLPQVHGDPELLQRMFGELISNAMLFNDAQLRRIDLGWDKDKECFYVRDNGIGIKDSALDRVFNVFCRLHHPGQYGDGAGMGLAIARRIARLHNGRIWIESQADEGSCVYIKLGLTA